MTKKFFKFLVLLFLVFSISGCFKTETASNFNDSGNLEPKKLSAEELEDQYQSLLAEILKPYWQNQGIAGIKDKILALTAPAEYLDLHFNLVVAFELIEQGQASADQAKIEEGLEKIGELKNQYSWINSE